MQPQTESQHWSIDGQQLRYINAVLQAGGIQPSIQYAGNGAYVITIVVPLGFDLPSFLDSQRQTPRRRPWWERIDIGRWVPVVMIVAVIAAVGYMLAYGAPAALADVMPAMPQIQMPEIRVDIPNPLAGVQQQVDAMMAGAVMIVQLAAGLVVLWLLWVFRGPLTAVGGAVWKGGSAAAGMVAKQAKKGKEKHA